MNEIAIRLSLYVPWDKEISEEEAQERAADLIDAIEKDYNISANMYDVRLQERE